MNLSQGTKLFWSVLLSVFLTNIPHLAWADALKQEMIPTSAVVGDMNREQAEQKVARFLDRADVKNELMRRGVSADEAAVRLASLSDQELNQLATQMDQARAGGDVTGILVVVLLVILIIFLVKRI